MPDDGRPGGPAAIRAADPEARVVVVTALDQKQALMDSIREARSTSSSSHSTGSGSSVSSRRSGPLCPTAATNPRRRGVNTSQSETERVRVLIVDDSALMRKLLGDLLSSRPEIEVVGSARDGARGRRSDGQAQTRRGHARCPDAGHVRARGPALDPGRPRRRRDHGQCVHPGKAPTSRSPLWKLAPSTSSPSPRGTSSPVSARAAISSSPRSSAPRSTGPGGRRRRVEPGLGTFATIPRPRPRPALVPPSSTARTGDTDFEIESLRPARRLHRHRHLHRRPPGPQGILAQGVFPDPADPHRSAYAGGVYLGVRRTVEPDLLGDREGSPGG